MNPDDPSVIHPILSTLRDSYLHNKTKHVSFRRQQLHNLIVGIKELTPKFASASEKDLGYSEFANKILSIQISLADIEHTHKHFEQWTKHTSVDTPLFIGPGKSYIVPEPLGVSLVMSAWNYPVFTALPPVASAIAAGNCVVLKPSEISPNTSNVLKELFDKYLDPECYRVIEGQIETSKAIIKEKWDLIIFTGSPEKGKIVALAAAENLTPCILELGGKNPCIVDQDADLENAALRVIQGRFTNSGQTCTAPDYVFVHSKIKEKLTAKFVEKVKDFFTDKPENSLDLVKIVSANHVRRLEEIIKENHGGKVLIGGQCDPENRFVHPTLVDNPKLTSRMMKEEIFGPILPILEFDDIENVINFIRERPKPLALYYFGGIFNKNKQRIIKETSSGSIAINESLFQVLNPELPFGGVQNSGQLSLHGKFGFDSCSHKKAVFDKLPINGKIMEMRYPPTNPKKIKNMLSFQEKTKNLYQSHIIKALMVFLVAFLGILFYVKFVDRNYGGVFGLVKQVLITMAKWIDRLPFQI